MNVVDLLTTLRERGVELHVREDKLKVIAPVGALTDELKALIKAWKAPLIEVLSQGSTGPSPGIVARPVDAEMPLSFAQKRLWFLNQLDDSGLYNVGGNFSVRGALDAAALEQALNLIVDRHAVLRTVYGERNGEPFQTVRPEARLILDRYRVDGDPAQKEAQWLRISAEYAARPFDLARDLMIRVGLVEYAADETRLMIHMHHIASDGTSLAVFIRELNRGYNALREGRESPLAPLPMQYHDYARWQHETCRRGDEFVGWEFWRDYLRDLPEVHALPLDAPRPAEQSHRGAVVATRVPKALVQQLSALGQAQGATLFITLSAAFSLLLSRCSGEDDIVFGTPIAGRDGHEVESLIGCFVNTLVLRTRIDGERSFEDFLRQYRGELLDAYQHQHVPFEYLVEALKPSRSLQHNPLFQIMFALHNQERASFALEGASFARLVQENNTSKFDLSLDALEGADGIELVWRYASDLFREQSVRRMGESFLALLQSIVDAPGRRMRELSLLSPDVRRRLLDFAMPLDAAVDLPAHLGDAFERTVRAFADRPALVDGERSLSYAALRETVDAACRTLVAAGIGAGDRVGVHLESSADLIVVTLALFRLGAVYVPLDPEYPEQRLRHMVDDSGATLVVAHAAQRARTASLCDRVLYWDACGPAPEVALPDALPTHASVAYIIYTSGSTGQPKGVMVSHGNLLHYRDAASALYGVNERDRVLQFSSPSFDIYIEELVIALLSGAALVIRDRAAPAARNFWEELQALRITVASLPTAYWHLLCSESPTEACAALRLLVVGGEKMSLDMLALWRRMPAFEGIRLLNTYGPTETTVIATAYDAGAHPIERGEIPIGRPLRHCRVAILDASGEPVAPGAVGELVVVGPMVALGYHDKPEQTAAAFVEIADADGMRHRAYRTGDMVRLDGDDQLIYMGRRDDQIKISGFRVTTGEIERQMMTVPGVAMAAVLYAGPRSGEQSGRLLAALASEDAPDALIDRVHQHLKAMLPYYMWPSAYTVVPELPLTANGKVARAQLMAGEFRAASTLAMQPPSTETEKALAALWAERLRVDPASIGRNTSFFEIGGHSLLAVRLLNDIRKTFGKQFGVRQIFETPQLARFADKIDLSVQDEAQPGAAPVAGLINREMPLSFAQKRLWFLNQLDDSGLYNIEGNFSVHGVLDAAVLEQALNVIVERHAVLRTVYGQRNGQPFQTVRPEARLALDRYRVDGDPAQKDAQWLRISAEYAARPFDLARDLMIRVGLVEYAADETRLMIHMHHIASDGWSLSVFIRELNQCYNALREGRESPLAPLPMQYHDYARWQHETCRRGDEFVGWEFWRDYLKDLPEVHALPLDAPRPAEQSHRGAVVATRVPKALVQQLSALGQAQGATLFITLSAVFSLLLSRCSGEDDIVFGTPIAGRDGHEVESLIGCFVNTLVLRARIDGERSFEDFLRQYRGELLDAYQHQQVPFEYLVEALKPNRRLQHNPLFQIMFALHYQEDTAFAIDGARFSRIAQDSGTSKFDLSLDALEGADGIELVWRYASDLFREQSVRRMGESFLALLQSIVDAPGRRMRELSLLSPDVRRRLLDFAMPPDAAVDLPAHLGDAFERTVRAFADRPALVDGERTLSYAALRETVDASCRTLVAAGIGAGDRVGVHLESSADLIVVTLALFRLGAVYVPLDPEYPEQRLRHMVDDSGATLVVAHAAQRARTASLCDRVLYWDECGPAPEVALPDAPPTHASVAYIIYTSGSTGQPKGVMVSHGNLLHYRDAASALYGVNERDRVLQFSSPSFDIYIEELVIALLSGAALVIRDRKAPAARNFWEEMQALRITVASLPTAYWHLLCSELPAMAERGHGRLQIGELRMFIAGGEKMSLDMLALWRKVPVLAGLRLFNVYGPTETTVIVTGYEADAHPIERGEIPIGRPLRHCIAAILDASGEPVAPGTVGELVVVGPMVALGYHDKPEQTAAAFVEIADADGVRHRAYRTGDMVRLDGDDQLIYMGRRDDQIKISGFRVTTGEIERQMMKVPGVAMAAVLYAGPRSGEQSGRLLAALASEDAPDALIDRVHQHLKAMLPYYMWPSAYTVVPELPLTANGKVARAQLMAGEFRAASTLAMQPPSTETEKALAALWAERLRVDPASIGRNTSFFEIGGHSLLAVRLLNDIRKTFGKQFGVRQIFEAPLLCEFAERIESTAPADEDDAAPQATASLSAPASFAQKQLWYIEQVTRTHGSYNIFDARRFDRALDLPLVERAVANVMDRHGALRTMFEMKDDELFQTVRDDVEFRLGVLDASGLSDDDRRVRMDEAARACAAHAFDLAAGPLLRMDAVRLDGETTLLLCIHHIAADGWSIDVFWRDFDAEYAALSQVGEPRTSPRPVQYIDYAMWQRRRLDDGVWKGAIDHWKDRLQGMPELHGLITDFPRPELQSFEGESYVWRVPDALRERIAALGARSNASMFMLIHAAFSVLLARRAGTADVVIGTPAANRDRAEIADMIGFLANVVILRTRVDLQMPFSAYLDMARKTVIDAQDHQEIPFQYLVEAINPARSAAYNPLVQILLTVQQEGGISLPEGSARFIDGHTAKFDITLNAFVSSEGLVLALNYCKALFGHRTILALADQLTALLDAIASQPDTPIAALDLVGEGERRWLLGQAGRLAWPGAAGEDRLYVLDEHMRPTPFGSEGELCVGGARVERAAAGASHDAIVPVTLGGDRFVLRTGRRVRYDHAERLVAARDASRRYWSSRLAGLPLRHGLPTSEGSVAAGDAVAMVPVQWSRADLDRLQALAARHGLTLPMVLHAGFAILLSRYGCERDVVVGFAENVRVPSELRALCAPLDALLPLRVDCDAERSTIEHLAHVRQAMLDAHSHRDMPLDEIAALCNPPRSAAPASLFQIALSVATGDWPAQETMAGMDLGLQVRSAADGIQLRFVFRDASLTSGLVRRMADDFDAILDQLGREACPLLRDFVLVHGTPDAAPQVEQAILADAQSVPEDACLHTLVEMQVDRTPDRVAVRHGDAALTYAQLNARANRVAAALRVRGVEPGALVGVCLPRGIDLVVAILAILKSGAAYVPMDPDYPAERLRYIAEDAALGCVLGSPDTRHCVDGLPLDLIDVTDAARFEAFPDGNVPVAMDNAGLAYLIYTSGTTGKPKGVMIAHGNAVAFLAWVHQVYPREQLAVVLAATSMCFDLSVFEMFAPLTCGGSCLLVPHILALQEPDAFAAGVTLINTVPSAIMQLLENGPLPPSVRVVNLAGEALLGHVVERVYAQPQIAAVYNLYGPSEDTTYSTVSLCGREAGAVPDIGVPIRGCEVRIVDRQGLPAPQGVAGELCIGGTGLSRGYWHRPELTAEKFVAGSRFGVPIERLYRTGDLARWNERGRLEFIGRLDQQVKLNGFRIELGEIETALSASGEVRSSGVLKIDESGPQRLVAFVEYFGESPASGDSEAIAARERRAKDHLRENLPGFMLPQEWVAVDAMPLSANGKIDRKALRSRYLDEWMHRKAPASSPVVSEMTTQERWVAALWMRLLKAKQVGLDENFFSLGGKSLLALQVVNAINREFGCRLSMVDLFKHPTIRELVARICVVGQGKPAAQDALLRIGSGGQPARDRADARSRLYLVHPIGGDILCYSPLVAGLDAGWDVFGLQMNEPHQSSVVELARRYVALLEAAHDGAPYHLCGYSFGGVVAFEMARQLEAKGAVIASLSLIDSELPADDARRPEVDLSALWAMLKELGPSRPGMWNGLDQSLAAGGVDAALADARERAVREGMIEQAVTFETLRDRFRIYRSNLVALRAYRGSDYGGDVGLLIAAEDTLRMVRQSWGGLARIRSVVELPCDHFTVMKPPHVEAVARWLTDRLRQGQVEEALAAQD